MGSTWRTLDSTLEDNEEDPYKHAIYLSIFVRHNGNPSCTNVYFRWKYLSNIQSGSCNLINYLVIEKTRKNYFLVNGKMWENNENIMTLDFYFSVSSVLQ